MNLKGYKMDGLGNDFLIIDQRKNPINLSEDQIRHLANRNNIGFDQ
jgi:diaminopimelate epimerase